MAETMIESRGLRRVYKTRKEEVEAVRGVDFVVETEASERGHVVHEAADVLYFTLARLAREGIDLAEVERHLDRRALKVTRRD